MPERTSRFVSPFLWRYAVRLSAVMMLAVLTITAAAVADAQGASVTPIDTAQYKVLRIKPSATNPAIQAWDTAHVVYVDPRIPSNKLLLWLAGTNGTPLSVPVELFKTALAQGYRVVALSYLTVPAVSQVCVGAALDSNVNCAEQFRRRRIYGDNVFPSIPDAPDDAIIPRFVGLLHWLHVNDAGGNWSRYLTSDGSRPDWQQVAIFGQSQGGGMAEFIAQHESVARMISFSGGWDYANSRERRIAAWYAKPSVTPKDRWFATYHVNENAAAQLREICTALQIPPEQVFALDQPLLAPQAASGNANPFHGDGIRNTVYRPIWIRMLGSGMD